jgi:hypothetical protein
MSTQLCEILYTDSQDMLVLSSTVASRYFNCYTDGSTHPGNYGYHLVYFDISFATVMNKPALYRLLTYHVPKLMSIFLSLGHLSKESTQVQGPL